MNITVIGTGYVGIVTGTCLAETGNKVTCVDIDEAKVATYSSGKVPIYEPHLESLLVRNLKAGRIDFTTDLAFAVAKSSVIFLALPTPPGENGSADLQYILDVAKELKVKLKLITDGDISGALLVCDEKYNVDLFLGIGGGPEGVLSASALDAYNCHFQGRFIFKDNKDISRARSRRSEADIGRSYQSTICRCPTERIQRAIRISVLCGRSSSFLYQGDG